MPGIPETLALELDGRALAVPGESKAWVIELGDGRIPLLVRDFGHLLGFCVSGSKAWSVRPASYDEATKKQIVAVTRTWARSCSAETATLYEIALRMAEGLTAALAEVWTVHFPGVPDPREAWLHEPRFDAAALGAMSRQVVVEVGGRQRHFAIGSRDAIAKQLPEVVVAVREQLAAFEANLAHSERIRTEAEELGARLSKRLANTCTVALWSRPSHSRAVEARLSCDSRELVRVFARDGVVVAHAGLVGDDGWEGTDLVAGLEAIVAAIELAERALTLDRLVRGQRYRVLRDIGDLRKGMVVEFTGYDDVDNHYGVYEFRSAEGRRLGVGGDYANPHASPLGQTHRYLARVEGSHDG